MLELLFVGLMQTAAGDPAPADPAPATEQSEPAQQARPERRRVCQRVVVDTGGRVPQRVCRWRTVQPEPADEEEAPEASEAQASESGGAAGASPAAAPQSEPD